MEESRKTAEFVRKSMDPYRVEPVHKKHKYYIGIDIGSVSSDVVVLDDNSKVVYRKNVA